MYFYRYESVYFGWLMFDTNFQWYRYVCREITLIRSKHKKNTFFLRKRNEITQNNIWTLYTITHESRLLKNDISNVRRYWYNSNIFHAEKADHWHSDRARMLKFTRKKRHWSHQKAPSADYHNNRTAKRASEMDVDPSRGGEPSSNRAFVYHSRSGRWPGGNVRAMREAHRHESGSLDKWTTRNVARSIGPVGSCRSDILEMHRGLWMIRKGGRDMNVVENVVSCVGLKN